MRSDDSIIIEGVNPRIDGTYTFSLNGLTNRDFNDLKRIAGLRARELGEAFEKGDTDLVVAFAVIALRHAGKPVDEDELWDAPMGMLKLKIGEEAEVDDLPPASAPPSETPSEPGGDGSPSDPSSSSGNGSINGSDPRESDPSRTGSLPLGIGVTSEFETLAT